MKIVIPVSSHDKDLINDFCNVVNFFGPYKNHELLVVTRPSDIRFGLNVFNNLYKLFSDSKIYMFDDDGTYGWPQGPNHYWKETIKHLTENNNNLPWFWMELDCTPVKNNWADLMEEEYNRSGNKCLGMIQNLLQGDLNTEHLVGVAIYPPDFATICKSWKDLDDNSLAFDVHCQKEVLPISTNSNIMHHHFRTSNYECTNDGLKGEIKDFYNSKYNFDKPISKETVIVHGCNDGSLARIITNT